MSKNLLEEFNKGEEAKIKQAKKAVLSSYKKRQNPNFSDYEFEELFSGIQFACNSIKASDTIEFEFIDRAKFNADIAVKIPGILKEEGDAEYIKEFVPKIVDALKASELAERGIFAEIKTIGIYINILLSPEFFMRVIGRVVQLKDYYGSSDVHKDRAIVLDYSSPNMAKHLHAGHIRSTLIGEVLAKIYEATGYVVHRFNFINDWGGMGAILEAYKRLEKAGKLPEAETKNGILYQIYLLVRKIEKIEDNNFNEAKDFAIVLGDFKNFAEFEIKRKEFNESALQRFHNLEAGAEEEFELWRQMREWSFADFATFYNLLGIRHDYNVGESFYSKRGEDLVRAWQKVGKVIQFTDADAQKEIEKLKALGLKDEEFAKLKGEVMDDVGAYVVPLEKGRLVLMRSDGRTIYATRDMASVKHRLDEFSPSRLVYEVGEEQSLHFKTLFEGVRKLGLVPPGINVDFKHLSHGFYVDAETGKKLSSREGALNVVSLIGEAEKYFRKKYDEREGRLSDSEKDKNAKMLAVGSIAFNDVKQDKRFPISFHKEMEKNIRNFEESGGAYIMYSVARARSILRKCEVSFDMLKAEARHFAELEAPECALIKKVADFPRVVIKSVQMDNPAVLAGFLLSLANDYNSYYENYQVLDGTKLLFPARLLITSAVATVMANGLKLCHAEAPEII